LITGGKIDVAMAALEVAPGGDLQIKRQNGAARLEFLPEGKILNLHRSLLFHPIHLFLKEVQRFTVQRFSLFARGFMKRHTVHTTGVSHPRRDRNMLMPYFCKEPPH
jgi:hypothetical protein